MPTIIGLNGIMEPEFLKLIELFSPNENHDEFIYVKELEVVKSLSGFSLLAGGDLIPFDKNLKLYFNRSHYKTHHKIFDIFNLADPKRIVYDSRLLSLMEEKQLLFMPETECLTEVDKILFQRDCSLNILMENIWFHTPCIQMATFFGINKNNKKELVVAAKNGYSNDNCCGMNDEKLVPNDILCINNIGKHRLVEQDPCITILEHPYWSDSVDNKNYNKLERLALYSRMENEQYYEKLQRRLILEELEMKTPDQVRQDVLITERLENANKEIRHSFKEVAPGKFYNGISKAIFVGDDGMEIEEQFVHNKEDIRVLNKWDLNHD